MAYDTVALRSQAPVDRMQSGHLEPQKRPSNEELAGVFADCKEQLDTLKRTAQMPLSPTNAYILQDLHAKTNYLQGHFDNQIREGGGQLPGMSKERTLQVYNASQDFKKDLADFSSHAASAANQQRALQRQNHGRASFNQQLSVMLTPGKIEPGTPQFGQQMQAELDRFSQIQQSVSQRYMLPSVGQMLKTAQMFTQFQQFALQHNVELPPAQNRAMEAFFGQVQHNIQLGAARLQPPASRPQLPAAPPSVSSGMSTNPSSRLTSPSSSSLASTSSHSSASSQTSVSSQGSTRSTAHRIGSWLKRQLVHSGPPQAPMSAADIAQRDKIESARWAEHNKNMEGVTIHTMDEMEQNRRNAEFNPAARGGKGRS